MKSRKAAPPSTVSTDTKPPLQPAYYLSLTVENVRCFGPRQTLDLSEGDGRPARWTVLLGNNGVGKTTLLQLLADMLPRHSPPSLYEIPRLFERSRWELEQLLPAGQDKCFVRGRIAFASGMSSDAKPALLDTEFRLVRAGNSSSLKDRAASAAPAHGR